MGKKGENTTTELETQETLELVPAEIQLTDNELDYFTWDKNKFH